MLCRLLAFLLLLSAASADSSTTTDLLWPLPRSTSFGKEVYSLNVDTFSFTGAGPGGGSDILGQNFLHYRLMIFQNPAPFYPSGGGGSVTQELEILVVTVESADETLGLTTSENCKSACLLLSLTPLQRVVSRAIVGPSACKSLLVFNITTAYYCKAV